MANWLKDFFYFTKQERNGTLVLAILCMLLFLLPSLYKYWVSPPPLEEEYRQQIASWQSGGQEQGKGAEAIALFYFDPNTLPKDSFTLLGLSPKVAQTIINYRQKVGTFKTKEELSKIYTLEEKDYKRLAPYVRIASSGNNNAQKKEPQDNAAPRALFSFDPNTASKEELLTLGFPERVANTLINYRSNGGSFRQAADLKKVYGLEETLFSELLPFISIPAEDRPIAAAVASEEPRKIPDSYSHLPAKPIAIDINTATAPDWQQLRGIGPAYAGRIVRFREALGGFVSIDQVAETYGLPDSTFRKIRPLLRFSPLQNKLRINYASEEELKSHPYLNWKQARALYNYRRQHGAFNSIEEVRKVRALPGEVVDKLEPYLEY